MSFPSPQVAGRRTLLAVTGTVTALLMAGCASVLDGDGGGDSRGTDQPSSTTYDHLSGPEDVLVSIRSDGTYSPAAYTLRNTSEFVLVGDGTAVVPGPMIEIYPGPAINSLQSATLTEQQIQDLYAAAERADLLSGEIDFGVPAVTDMAYTTVSITVGDQDYGHQAYALGYSDEPATGLTEAQLAAREALQGFIDAAHATVDAASQPYVPTLVAVFRLGPDEAVVDPGLEQAAMEWPIGTVPPEFVESLRSCSIVMGQEAAQLLDALTGANELTPWLIGADPPAYFAFRPLLADDFGCEL